VDVVIRWWLRWKDNIPAETVTPPISGQVQFTMRTRRNAPLLEAPVEFTEVLPWLQENHTAIVSTVGASGKAQATVVSAAPLDGKIAFVSKGRTIKVKNVRRSGRCTVTLIKLDTRRYITVEGPAVAHSWDDTGDAEMLALLRGAYSAAERDPAGWDDFDKSMREEKREIVLVTPERVYGSI
jgi:PPOX class probable F420-dependent enzyme